MSDATVVTVEDVDVEEELQATATLGFLAAGAVKIDDNRVIGLGEEPIFTGAVNSNGSILGAVTNSSLIGAVPALGIASACIGRGIEICVMDG